MGCGWEAWVVPSSAARNAHTSARRRSSESLRRKFIAPPRYRLCRPVLSGVEGTEVTDVQYRAGPLGRVLEHGLDSGPDLDALRLADAVEQEVVRSVQLDERQRLRRVERLALDAAVGGR